MCGIIGYIGQQEASQIILDGLKRMEYRGYDSSGLVVFDQQNSKCLKSVGKLDALTKLLSENKLLGKIGLGHNRWATHGAPKTENAHPHHDCKEKIWLAHNGIIENYQQLKTQLISKGHTFLSETDTEVIAHLLEEFFENNIKETVKKVLPLLKGTYGLVVVNQDEPDKIIVARHGSPLVIGLGQNELIVASDVSAILRHTDKVIYLEDGEMAELRNDGYSIFNTSNEITDKEVSKIEWNIEQAEKGGYPHFMLKEIFEQPESTTNSIRGRTIIEQGNAKLGGLESVAEKLRKIKKIHLVACGTAYHSAKIASYMLEEYAGIPATAEYASEYRYKKPLIDDETAVLAISQSGETADTLAAIREGKEKGALTLGLINTVGSTIARETEAGVYNHIGPEIAVASTKAFTSQLSILTLITLFLGRQRQMSLVTGQRIINELNEIPNLIKKILESNQLIQEISKKYSYFKNVGYIGRKYNQALAFEGALKLKEISYIHAEGFPAGELKHGHIAMIDENFLTIAICPQDSVYEKNISNIQEIKARGGKVIAIATIGDEEISKIADEVIYIPKTLEILTPILAAVPLQLLAYHISVIKGNDVDKPRNLAKSVTVE